MCSVHLFTLINLELLIYFKLFCVYTNKNHHLFYILELVYFIKNKCILSLCSIFDLYLLKCIILYCNTFVQTHSHLGYSNIRKQKSHRKHKPSPGRQNTIINLEKVVCHLSNNVCITWPLPMPIAHRPGWN